jgi:hypothetical protein
MFTSGKTRLVLPAGMRSILGAGLLLILAGAFSTCGPARDEPGPSAPAYGAIIAQAVWPGDPGYPGLLSLEGIHPLNAPANVQSIVATVTGADMSPVSATFDTTPGASGSGVIKNVPAGSNRTLTLNGYSSDNGGGLAIFQGKAFGITVTAGQTSNTGTVAMTISIIQVAAGGNHTCALDAGAVTCWGDNFWGQSTVPALTSPTQVAPGNAHTCALRAGGVTCWGLAINGQTTVPTLTNPTQVTSGNAHSCALHAGGVTCWGDNSQGQTTVPALTTPTQVAAGAGSYVCALHAGGVTCWGYNGHGQTTVPALTAPTQVAAGAQHACAIHAGGVICWGLNTSGQTTVPALINPTQVAAGQSHTCAVHAGGVTCWGDNTYGQTTVP